MEEKPYRFHDEIKFECGSLVVGWKEDTAQMGSGVIGYLKDHLKCRLLAEIEPTGFFSLSGVSIEGNVARFPESKLYYCAEKDLLLFESDPPHSEWYKYLNTIIEMAQFHCSLREIYTIGGMISLNSHTTARKLMATVNDPEAKGTISKSNIDTTINYETPNGQRPTINSYLIWVTKQQKIQGISIWVPVPFYLTNLADPQSWRQVLDFFNTRYNLEIDFGDLDREIKTQNERLDRARMDTPELDGFLSRLESSQTLTQEENDKLIKEVGEILRRND